MVELFLCLARKKSEFYSISDGLRVERSNHLMSHTCVRTDNPTRESLPKGSGVKNSNE